MDSFVQFCIFASLIYSCFLCQTKWVKWRKHQNWMAIENALVFLAANLTLDDDFIREAKRVAQITFEQVKQEGSRRNLKIGRTIIAGSIGKGTGITYMNVVRKRIYPDLDLIIYINGTKPPFGKELLLLKEILEEINEVSGLEERRDSLKCYFKTESYGQIKIDLLPAENHVVKTQQLRGQDIGEVQARYTSQDLIRQQDIAIRQTGEVNRRENKLRSSSLAEISVKIIIDEVADEYVWNVVKLAKFWNSMLDMSGCGYVPARSYIIELVAIFTLKTEFQHFEDDQKSLHRGFKYFLQAMSKFRELDVTLNNEECLSEEVPQYSPPIIRDPANMLNNLAEGVPKEAIQIWEEHAKQALKVLNKEVFKKPLGIISYRLFGNAIDDVFSHKYER